jgi:hypothetical protein
VVAAPPVPPASAATDVAAAKAPAPSSASPDIAPADTTDGTPWMMLLVGLAIVVGAALFIVAWRHNARRQPSAG